MEGPIATAKPTLVCVDVEPDELSPPRGTREPWHGFVAAHKVLSELRTRIEQATGSPARFSWFCRMDPQVVDAYGSATWAVDRHQEIFDDILARGDEVGVHPHVARWLPDSGTWLSDFDDQAWVEHCLTSALAAFKSALGRPSTSVRFPAWLNDETVAALEREGVRFDVSLIPGQRPNRRFLTGGPVRGGMAATFRMPHEPYRPSTEDFRVPDLNGGRSLTIIPLTTAPLRLGPHPRGIARFLSTFARTGRFGAEGVLHPPGRYRYPDDFPSLLERAIDCRRHVAFALRSDFPVRPDRDVRVRRALDAILDQAARSRLTCTTPADAVRLLSLEAAPS